MDAASLSPLLWPSTKGSYFKYLRNLRESLRKELSLKYHLDDFNILFVPSVRVGLAFLSHILYKNNYILDLDGNNCYQPIAEIFSGSIDYPCHYVKRVKIITHIGPYNGVLSNFQLSDDSIVDASHSFATVLHSDLIKKSKVFLAPLHKHASIAIGLAILVVRKNCFNQEIMTDLCLFEEATASAKPFEQALRSMAAKQWKPYNISSVNQVAIKERNLFSISEPGLPFVCFSAKLTNESQKNLIDKLGGCYFEHAQTLRFSYMIRGFDTELMDHTEEAIFALRQFASVNEVIK